MNDKHIFASSWDNGPIFVFNHDGTLLDKHGIHGRGKAGYFDIPLLCHGDDDGDVLIADVGNHRLQVLHSNGHFSVVNIPDILRPRSAIYTPGRLYVLEKDPSPQRNRINVYLPDQIKIKNLENEYE